jgi:MoxR-like ATPase
MKIETQIKTMIEVMSKGIYEKEHILAMALLSAIAGESIFLLGPPGTAKSLVARRLQIQYLMK